MRRALLIASLAVWGCKDDAAREAAAAAEAARSGVSLFDPAFAWHCSPDDGVACSGTFDVRQDALQTAPISGQDALGVRIASLRAATRSIRIQALIFRADETGLHLAELLEERKRAGVDIRVIVDAVSNLDWHTQWMYFDLKRHGIEVEGYEALYLEWLTAEKILEPLHANKRFHDKMWIVDAEDEDKRMAIVGGLNLANAYFRVDPTPLEQWRDQDVVLRGPVVADVADAFDRNYDFFKHIKGKLPKVLNPDNAWKLTRELQDKVAAVEVPTWPDAALGATVQACGARELDAAFAPDAMRFVQSRPRLRETFLLQAYIALIESAQRSILIANAYFIPSREIADALLRAIDRGVEVVVLTNSPESNDIAEVAVVSRATYKGLMREDGGGVQFHEWIGPAIGEGTLHAKYMLVDDEEAIVGSYNLDPRSERLNSETAVAIRDVKLVSRMATEFREDLLAKARAVGWDDAVAHHNPDDLGAKFKLLYSTPLESWL
jgi:putative cardiolipin synthase